MAVDGFGTTTEEMTRAAQHVAGVNQAVQGELTALRGRLEPLAGAWVGRAATQFAQLMVRWDADARSLNQALGGDRPRDRGVAHHVPAAGRRSDRRR